MNKLLILALLSVFLNAGQSDNNEPKSDAELLKEFQELSKKENESDLKIKEAKAKTLKSETELNTSKKLGKTLDELGNKLGVDKK